MQRILQARFGSAAGAAAPLLRAAENAATAAGRPVRVRFAPSPTGSLHLGGLRSALFNYLFARSSGGTFILRIEDTDKTRQKPGSITGLVNSLRWCGLDYDEGPDPKATHDHDCTAGCSFEAHGHEPKHSTSPSMTAADAHAEASQFGSKGAFGPYIQSQRLPLYCAEVERLLSSGQAYRCFCTPERLAALRESQAKAGVHNPVYDRACLKLPPGEAEARAAAGQPHVVRMLVPAGSTTLVDEVLGDVSFTHAGVDDQVLLKSDGYPTYHLASVVDDHAMAISHVIRGQEWLSSSPKHVLLYRALGWTPPAFAHLPLLLNADRSKLSKRHGDASVEDFMAAGYTPEALVNFVAFLGWSPPLPGQVQVQVNGPGSAAAAAASAAPAASGKSASKGSAAAACNGGASVAGAASAPGRGKINPFKVTLPAGGAGAAAVGSVTTKASSVGAADAAGKAAAKPAAESSPSSSSSSSWLPPEVMTLPEMTRLFSLTRVNKANAVVDVARLDFLNGQHIRRMLLGASDGAAGQHGSNSASSGAATTANDGLTGERAMSQAEARALPKAALLPIHVQGSPDARAVADAVLPHLERRFSALRHADTGAGATAAGSASAAGEGAGVRSLLVDDWPATRWNGLLVAQHERVQKFEDFAELLLPLVVTTATRTGGHHDVATAPGSGSASASGSGSGSGSGSVLPGSFGVWMRRCAADRLTAIEKACAGARKAAGLPPATYPLPTASASASAGAPDIDVSGSAAAGVAGAADSEALAAALRTADADVRTLVQQPAVRRALTEVLTRWQALQAEPPSAATGPAASTAANTTAAAAGTGAPSQRSFLDGDAAGAAVKEAAAAAGVPAGALMPLLRYLMTGSGVGAALSSTLRLLGHAESCARLQAWLV